MVSVNAKIVASLLLAMLAHALHKLLSTTTIAMLATLNTVHFAKLTQYVTRALVHLFLQATEAQLVCALQHM